MKIFFLLLVLINVFYLDIVNAQTHCGCTSDVASVTIPDAPINTYVSVDIPFTMNANSYSYNVYLQTYTNYPQSYASTIALNPSYISSYPDIARNVNVQLTLKTPPLAGDYSITVRYSCSSSPYSWSTVTAYGKAVVPAPTNLSATNITCTGCSLSWSASDGATSYRVYKNGTLLALGLSSTNYSVTGLTINSPYIFQVSAVGNNGAESAKSSGVSVTTLSVPSAPYNLTATNVGCTSASLSWNAPLGTITGYNIYENGSLKTTTLASVTSISLTDLTHATSYIYTVSANNDCGQSLQSEGLSFTTLAGPPVPYAFHPTSVSSTSISLTWNPVSNITGYYLYIYINGSLLTKIATTNTYFSSSGFHGYHCFYVSSYNSICESPKSYAICYTFASYSIANEDNLVLKSNEAISTLSEKDVILLPNPAFDKVYVDGITDFGATIFDLSGKKVLNVNNVNGSIDISGLKQGVYVVHLISNGNTIIKKLVKQ